METLQKEIDDKKAVEPSEEPSNGNEGGDGADVTQSKQQQPAKIKSPSLLEIGLSKNALRSMGIHFRKDEEEEQGYVGHPQQTRASNQPQTNHAGNIPFSPASWCEITHVMI